MTLNRIHLFSFLILLLAMSSCMPGKKAATQFIEKRSDISVMIVPPPLTFYSYYPFNPDFADEFPDHNPKDLEESFFFKEKNDSLIQEICMRSLVNELNAFGLNTFTSESFDLFLNRTGEKYIFTIAQSELIEYDDLKTERALIDDMLYSQDFLIRHLEQNTWFEFVKVDESSATPPAGMQVLFSTFTRTDEVNGRFRYRPLTGNVYYEYSSEMLKKEDLYQHVHFSGKENARFIFEFLLNNYIRKNSDPLLSQPARFRYRKDTDRLVTIDRRLGFIILDTP